MFLIKQWCRISLITLLYYKYTVDGRNPHRTESRIAIVANLEVKFPAKYLNLKLMCVNRKVFGKSEKVSGPPILRVVQDFVHGPLQETASGETKSTVTGFKPEDAAEGFSLTPGTPPSPRSRPV